MKPAIAIVTPNILMGLGLRTILEKLIPMAEISTFDHYEAFDASGSEQYFHYFVAVSVFVRHSTFFQAQRHKTILLGNGRQTQFTEMHQLNVFESEEKLIHNILRLRHDIHHHEYPLPTRTQSVELLSAREIEVVELVANGLINKEIADKMNIGVTTVISHRRNIMEKLNIKSAAELAIYAVDMGYVDTGNL